MSYRRFFDCSVSERLLYTLFILLISTGYLFAMALIYINVGSEDGKPGLTVKDITIKYYGNRSGSRLEQALTGIMKANRTNDEYLTIAEWIHNGAPESGYEKKIKPILDSRCVACHSAGSGFNIPPLTSYKEVLPLVAVDTGESIGALVRVSHIHLFGLSIIFYLLGRIFILTEIPVWLKRLAVIIPFAAIAADIGSWWFTKFSPHFFAYTVIVSGALMGLSFAFQALLCLYQMWFVKAGFDRNYVGGEYVERRKEG
ncbi:MAG: hypothetical protein BMS9Abin23_0530 [Thermodesulfobacteriota bacterium]|nr:MAG: hypothetical protein BMS9Abin23_0530 [Thermodesulfobacteriota bacterium]